MQHHGVQSPCLEDTELVQKVPGTYRKAQCELIRRYLSHPQNWFESGGRSSAAAASVRMRTLRVECKVGDGPHESRT